MEIEKATEVDAVEMESEDLIGPTQSTENNENDTEVDAPTLMSKEMESEDLIGPTQSTDNIENQIETENIENEIEINSPMLDAEEIDNAQNPEDIGGSSLRIILTSYFLMLRFQTKIVSIPKTFVDFLNHNDSGTEINSDLLEHDINVIVPTIYFCMQTLA